MSDQWVCNACGNTNKFRGEQDVKQWARQTITFKGDNEDDYEVEDSDVNDEEVENGVEDVECEECGSNSCDALSKKDYDTWRELHFNIEDEFFEEELTPEQREKSSEALKVAFKL